MPPKKGIVKSGNSGNSSKASNSVQKTPELDAERHLFPPGVKTPLSLLHERCQKNGWDKPIIDTRKQGDGYTFSIRLNQLNKKTSLKETVRLESYPPYICPTALEARHWGATYALYRFCNGMQLNRILPSGPKEYWQQLAAEHKSVPEHQQWMYAADPFVAQRDVRARQESRSAQQSPHHTDKGISISSRPVTSTEYDRYPEVKMASGIRETVEECIKQAILLYPEASEDVAPSSINEDQARETNIQLQHIGFSFAQSQKATKFLSKQTPFTTSLLSSLSPLEASIEYLVLHTPECDLPSRFLPDFNSSNSFVTSAHSGTDNLKRRWVEDKAVKEAGFPAHLVKEYTSTPEMLSNWSLLITTLGQRLIGNPHPVVENFQHDEPFPLDIDEIEALGGGLGTDGHLTMPLFSAPLTLHILTSPAQSPCRGYSPIFITSPSVPSYVRLHLLSVALCAIDQDDFIQPGEGFCLACMRILEDEWAAIESYGPPEISTVLHHILPKREVAHLSDQTVQAPSNATNKARRNLDRSYKKTKSSNIEILNKFLAMSKRPEYLTLMDVRQRLPAFAARDTFLDYLSNNRVVIVVGETGCGKTTQLPQFILDSLIMSGAGSDASIIVTQPRRLSAIGVATRVSAERLDDGSVGYSIRGESTQTRQTKLLFCTTGIVLRRLSGGDALDGVSHVVVDEVHERSVDSDFLLLELKDLLQTHPTLKVILMSATINHETFIKYFDGAPLLEIPGFTYPVIDKYLDDIIPLIKYRPPYKQNRRNDKRIEDAQTTDKLDTDPDAAALKAVLEARETDYKLIASIVDHIVATETKAAGILIFLSGVQEIRQCIQTISDIVPTRVADTIPLHANLSSEEQRRVFAKTSKWKIIASTNVAETSITIDDVIYVIDVGRVKENRYDPETDLTCLKEIWITRAAGRQRRGRAGRTQPVPEILRVPLESISLSVKVTRPNEDVKHFLQRAIDPPELTAMQKAWSVLEDLGAIERHTGNLTPLGRHISQLPVDLRLAKMLVLAVIFRCLNPILTIVASLSLKPLFSNPIEKRDLANRTRERFNLWGSDLLTDVQAYDQCIKMHKEGQSQAAIRQFCNDNFIAAATVKDITMLRQDFLSSLVDTGFISSSRDELSQNSSNIPLVKGIITGGLYPRIAKLHLPKRAIKFDKIQAGTVQRENTAKEYVLYDLSNTTEQRVFLHPSAVLFGKSNWKVNFVSYFQKQMTTKVYIRSVSEVPMYALLLFGGIVSVDHIKGGLSVACAQDHVIKLKAWPRIGILVNQLRRLLDFQLEKCIEDGTSLVQEQQNPILRGMLAILQNDGLSSDQL